MIAADVRRLVEAVQTNCHIADAHHAGDLPLCIYLLQMREFYRWEQGLAFGADLPREALGSWLAEREALWDTLAASEPRPLPCRGEWVDPFDLAPVNAALHSAGLGYGAGLIGPGRPAFFVAERVRSSPLAVDGETVLTEVFGRELARNLTSPPALLAAGSTIVLRQAALARWLWERFEAHGLRPMDGSFQKVAAAFGLHTGADFSAALPRLLEELAPVLMLHEVGELRAGRWLGTAWARLRTSLAGQRRAELRLQAVRDHLADLGTTLPALVDGDAPVLVHFWFAAYEGHRQALFPGLKRAYAAWCDGDGGKSLRRAARSGHAHFKVLADELLDLHLRLGMQAAEAVVSRLDEASATCLAAG